MNTTQTKNGFTIIEVVLVLAIAGLIFLMVFIALPALQRGQRDSQRRDDVARVNTQLQNYQSSARGSVPTSTTAFGTFVSNYITPHQDEYQDPQQGNYTLSYQDATSSGKPSKGQIWYTNRAVCSTDGTGSVTAVTSTRSYALRIFLEGQDAPYCIDNR